MISNRRRAIAAASEVAASLELPVADAVVLQESNKLAVRLRPCDVLARIAEAQVMAGLEFEIGLAVRLAETQAPIGVLDPRVEPRAYVREGFVVTFWTYYETAASRDVLPGDYAHALEQLHSGMRRIDIPAPHFTDRISDAQRLVGNRDQTPALADADRELLSGALQYLRRTITGRGRPEQLLHGEPHPGNVLATTDGPRFIDLETCCRGPIEFDLAHAPDEVSLHYPGADQQLLRDCQLLMLAMVASWRWDRDDQFPNGRREGRDYVRALRQALSGAPAAAQSLLRRLAPRA